MCVGMFKYVSACQIQRCYWVHDLSMCSRDISYVSYNGLIGGYRFITRSEKMMLAVHFKRGDGELREIEKNIVEWRRIGGAPEGKGNCPNSTPWRRACVCAC